MKYILTLIAALVLFGCTESESPPLLYHVEEKPFDVKIPAKGELFAAQATAINAPMSSNGMQVIAWLAPEFSHVKKGDVIIRFDGESMQVESKNKLNELAKTQQDMLEKSGALNKELSGINKDMIMVDQEKLFAEQFSIEDERIRSKLEIIESLQNAEYLGTKQDYLNWKSDSFSESAKGDMGLLEMKQQLHQTKIDQLSARLSQLEVKAPHDGLLAYKVNWRGEKARTGQTMWPGQKIAELPDTSVMKAKLWVIENEAIDLGKGKKVSLRLNANAQQVYYGTIAAVTAFPKTIRRGDPQKYFEVIVELDEQHPDQFVPGQKVEALITVMAKKSRLIVPKQSVFSDRNQSYVYLYKSGDFIKNKVEIGQSSLSYFEITSGLTSGQEISLISQEKR
ncbi:efflux RND transporter periplasmic adaptor subunit [Thalassotalea piscium]|uniref:Multidrug efflux pump subunit AcrA (Membrane-fusion protein) n=1 Tax=Thalassotalea piscium TaxID=1230533 RepID=A0A7X0NIR3_9GAMM|nr:HlyD family efflux transporter periplasmic adaptor subunit [Thalassotalea piscium]MBB6544222.1 multidrug efflux pump subunit AcrA (membrane-fusion protein) [Thalassotalea piscium]